MNENKSYKVGHYLVAGFMIDGLSYIQSKERGQRFSSKKDLTWFFF